MYFLAPRKLLMHDAMPSQGQANAVMGQFSVFPYIRPCFTPRAEKPLLPEHWGQFWCFSIDKTTGEKEKCVSFSDLVWGLTSRSPETFKLEKHSNMICLPQCTQLLLPPPDKKTEAWRSQGLVQRHKASECLAYFQVSIFSPPWNWQHYNLKKKTAF